MYASRICQRAARGVPAGGGAVLPLPGVASLRRVDLISGSCPQVEFGLCTRHDGATCQQKNTSQGFSKFGAAIKTVYSWVWQGTRRWSSFRLGDYVSACVGAGSLAGCDRGAGFDVFTVSVGVGAQEFRHFLFGKVPNRRAFFDSLNHMREADQHLHLSNGQAVTYQQPFAPNRNVAGAAAVLAFVAVYSVADWLKRIAFRSGRSQEKTMTGVNGTACQNRTGEGIRREAMHLGFGWRMKTRPARHGGE